MKSFAYGFALLMVAQCVQSVSVSRKRALRSAPVMATTTVAATATTVAATVATTTVAATAATTVAATAATTVAAGTVAATNGSVANGSVANGSVASGTVMGNATGNATGNGTANDTTMIPAAATEAPNACPTPYTITEPSLGTETYMVGESAPIRWTPAACTSPFVDIELCNYQSGGNLSCYGQGIYTNIKTYHSNDGSVDVVINSAPPAENPYYCWKLTDDVDATKSATSTYFMLASPVVTR